MLSNLKKYSLIYNPLSDQNVKNEFKNHDHPVPALLAMLQGQPDQEVLVSAVVPNAEGKKQLEVLKTNQSVCYHEQDAYDFTKVILNTKNNSNLFERFKDEDIKLQGIANYLSVNNLNVKQINNIYINIFNKIQESQGENEKTAVEPAKLNITCKIGDPSQANKTSSFKINSDVLTFSDRLHNAVDMSSYNEAKEFFISVALEKDFNPSYYNFVIETIDYISKQKCSIQNIIIEAPIDIFDSKDTIKPESILNSFPRIFSDQKDKEVLHMFMKNPKYVNDIMTSEKINCKLTFQKFQEKFQFLEVYIHILNDWGLIIEEDGAYRISDDIKKFLKYDEKLKFPRYYHRYKVSECAQLLSSIIENPLTADIASFFQTFLFLAELNDVKSEADVRSLFYTIASDLNVTHNEVSAEENLALKFDNVFEDDKSRMRCEFKYKNFVITGSLQIILRATQDSNKKNVEILLALDIGEKIKNVKEQEPNVEARDKQKVNENDKKKRIISGEITVMYPEREDVVHRYYTIYQNQLLMICFKPMAFVNFIIEKCLDDKIGHLSSTPSPTLQSVSSGSIYVPSPSYCTTSNVPNSRMKTRFCSRSIEIIQEESDEGPATIQKKSKNSGKTNTRSRKRKNEEEHEFVQHEDASISPKNKKRKTLYRPKANKASPSSDTSNEGSETITIQELDKTSEGTIERTDNNPFPCSSSSQEKFKKTGKKDTSSKKRKNEEVEHEHVQNEDASISNKNKKQKPDTSAGTINSTETSSSTSSSSSQNKYNLRARKKNHPKK